MKENNWEDTSTPNLLLSSQVMFEPLRSHPHQAVAEQLTCEVSALKF